VPMSVVRSDALWPDTLTPVPKGTKGVVPVGRGVAPRSCSPGTPKRGEHPTHSLVDGATRPEGTQERIDEVRRVDSGDYTPQDRRSTNIGLLHKGAKYSQTVRSQHWATQKYQWYKFPQSRDTWSDTAQPQTDSFTPPSDTVN
jgi:hypothetical protein